jgi:hypothetical protein
MNKKRVLVFVFALFVLLAAALVSFSVSLSVGVKKGDWIEYQVETSGLAPGDHDAKWASMDVMNVQGAVINLNVTTQFNNGTFLIENVTLNLETGQIGDAFFVPANMHKGDVFFDAHQGNITIDAVEQRNYAGAQRTVVSGSSQQTTFYWDQQTGVLVEAHSSYPEYNFVMNTVADKTNMWGPQVFGLETTAFYVLAAAATGIVAAIGVILALKRGKKTS